MVDDLTKSYKILLETALIAAEENNEEEITDAEGVAKEVPVVIATTEGQDEEQGKETEEDLLATHEAYANVIFDLAVIAEIATYKSSVVGVSWSRLFGTHNSVLRTLYSVLCTLYSILCTLYSV